MGLKRQFHNDTPHPFVSRAESYFTRRGARFRDQLAKLRRAAAGAGCIRKRIRVLHVSRVSPKTFIFQTTVYRKPFSRRIQQKPLFEARRGPNNCLIDASQLSLNYVTCCTGRCAAGLFARGDVVTTAPSQLVQRESTRNMGTRYVSHISSRLPFVDGPREALAPEIVSCGKLENRISRNGRLFESFSREDSSELGCTRFPRSKRGKEREGGRDETTRPV